MSPEWNFQLPPNSRALKMGSGSWFWSAQKDGSQKKSESMSNFQIPKPQNPKVQFLESLGVNI